MDTMETNRQMDTGMPAGEDESKIKQKLGDIGRRIKRVDLRSQIVSHPFAAVGIAAGIGAIVGLARPMPYRGRISAAMGALATTLVFRLAREAAFMRLAQYAKQQFMGREDANEGMSAQAPQAGVGGY